MKINLKWLKRQNLDEMQELQLLKLEHKGFWLGFWGLVIAIAVQTFLSDPTELGSRLSGELIVLICMCLYTLASCMRAGLWDRHIPATLSANLGLSLLTAVVVALFFGLLSYKNYQSLSGSLATAGFQFLLIGVTVFAALTVTSSLYRKRRHDLDNEESSRNGKDNDSLL